MRLLFSILIIITVLAVFILPISCHTPAAVDDNLKKAAIIDQLYIRESNPELIAQVTGVLESYGFKVDVWQGVDISVDFYRKLPSLGYKLILLRVHSGLLVSLEGDKVITLDTTYLFTAENYTTTRYITDQLTDKVSNAVMGENTPLVFAVNSEFIRDAEGQFNHTVVLAMGCESYKYDDMPAVFIQKGASVYIGWNDVVSLEHADRVILSLIKNLCTANLSVSQSTSSTMKETGADPYFGSYLRYYPLESGDKTVEELIQGH